MKKTFAAVTVILMLFSLLGMSSCGGKENGGVYEMRVTPEEASSVVPPSENSVTTTEPVTFEPGDRYVGGEESFFLTADKTVVSPGDTVTVTLHAENCKNVACFDVLVSSSGALEQTESREKDHGDFIVTVSETAVGIQYSAIVATTADIGSLELLTVTYTVSSAAASGDELTVRADFSQYLVGTDESGDTVADATSLISVEPLTLTLA